MSDDVLLLDRPAPGVAVLTLDRPGNLNAVTIAMQRRLDEALTELERDPDVRCIVLTGAGDRAFCAGYDVHEMGEWTADELVFSLLEREPMVWHWASTPLPVIAAVNGIAYGFGAIVATAVDVRLGCGEAVFRFTAAAHGGANATWSLPSLVGRGRAAEILMSARTVPSDEAERIGLLDRVVPRAQLLPVALELAGAVASNPPAGVQAVKRLLREHEGRSIEDRFIAENLAMRTVLRPRPVGELYENFMRDRRPR